jgi:hypothetical protein
MVQVYALLVRLPGGGGGCATASAAAGSKKRTRRRAGGDGRTEKQEPRGEGERKDCCWIGLCYELGPSQMGFVYRPIPRPRNAQQKPLNVGPNPRFGFDGSMGCMLPAFEAPKILQFDFFNNGNRISGLCKARSPGLFLYLEGTRE